MWEWDDKEGWVPKNLWFQTMVLEKSLESPLDCKEIKPINHKGSQSWIFIKRTDAESEVPILWPPDAKCWLTGKDPDAGKDWGHEEKGATEDEMVGWHQWVNGNESEQTPRESEVQGSLACCSPWGHKKLDATEQQQNGQLIYQLFLLSFFGGWGCLICCLLHLFLTSSATTLLNSFCWLFLTNHSEENTVCIGHVLFGLNKGKLFENGLPENFQTGQIMTSL